MGDEPRLDHEWPDPPGSFCERRYVEGLSREAGVAVERIETLGEAGRSKDDDTARRRELPLEVVAQSYEIDEVVRMQVAHKYCGEGAGLDLGGQIRKRALAEVHEQ